LAVGGGGESLGFVGFAGLALEGNDVLEKADEIIVALERFIAVADLAVFVSLQLTGLTLKLVLLADLG
jgi:hypothetical protein